MHLRVVCAFHGDFLHFKLVPPSHVSDFFRIVVGQQKVPFDPAKDFEKSLVAQFKLSASRIRPRGQIPLAVFKINNALILES